MHELNNLDINMSETVRNDYFWLEEKFLRFLFNSQSFLLQKFATNTAKVRNGLFWTTLIKFRVFLLFKSLNENFSGTVCT